MHSEIQANIAIAQLDDSELTELVTLSIPKVNYEDIDKPNNR